MENWRVIISVDDECDCNCERYTCDCNHHLLIYNFTSEKEAKEAVKRWKVAVAPLVGKVTITHSWDYRV